MCSEFCIYMYVSLPGDPVVYTHWVPGRKSWNHGVEDCAILVNGYHGQWEDFECDHHRHYICEFGKFIVWFFVHEVALHQWSLFRRRYRRQRRCLRRCLLIG